MSTVDRSKFKAAKLTANANVVKEVEENTFKGNSNDSRPKYHDIKEGKNIFRIAPPHPEEDPDVVVSSIQPKCVAWLPQVVRDKDNKEIIKNKALFTAKIHGVTVSGERFTKDPVEEYIAFVRAILTEEQKAAGKKDRETKDAVKSLMAPLLGYRDKNGKWIPGYKPSVSYVCYAWKNGKLGRLALRESMVSAMNNLSIAEDSDEPIETDLFSDPDNGYSLIITYDKKAKDSSKKYLVSRGTQPRPLSDEQLIELDSVDTLRSMFYDAYDMGTFNKTVNGLRMIDEELEFGVFEYQEFIDILEEIREQVQPEREKRVDNDEEHEDEIPAPVSNEAKAPASRPVSRTTTVATKAPARRTTKPPLFDDDGEIKADPDKRPPVGAYVEEANPDAEAENDGVERRGIGKVVRPAARRTVEQQTQQQQQVVRPSARDLRKTLGGKS